MNSICITGALEPDLQLVSSVLQQAGMNLPHPAMRGKEIDIARWHEKVMALDKTKNAPTELVPSSLSVQLARDIFAGSINFPLWGWADSRSTWLLDFWLNFEPHLNFVLVCISPQQFLANAMAADAESISVRAIVNAWQMHHERLLRFHLRNTRRCILVDVHDCAKNPRALVERCASQWNLPIGLQANTIANREEPDSLALYLAQQLIKEFGQIAGLQREIAATVNRLGETTDLAGTISSATDQDTIVSTYRSLKDRTAEISLLQSVRNELDSLKLQNRDIISRQAQDQIGFANRVNQAEKENDLLLSQLLLIQEEHEAVLHERSSQSEALRNAVVNLKRAEQEDNLLHMQLRQVEDELGLCIRQRREAQQQLEVASDRWRRMLNRTPGYLEYESIKLLNEGKGQDGATTWRIEKFDVAGRYLPELEIRTVLEQGVLGIVLPRPQRDASPLVRWPSNASDQNEITLIPVGEPVEISHRLDTLRDLATCDWDFLRDLIRVLGNALKAPTAVKLRSKPHLEALQFGLRNLNRHIENFPATLRYDSVELKREQVNPDYEHLWLRFSNLAFGLKRWSQFEFRLSCANVRPHEFGRYPKLEFPKEFSEAPFDAWYVEASDDFGEKLELRFALPDSMDLAVWRRVSEGDRGFLSSLIERLPAILMNLNKGQTHLKRPWDDWVGMARDIQRITGLRTAPSLVTFVPTWVKRAAESLRRPMAPRSTVKSTPPR